jgi:FtsP/CotA-like multicopper oxidase with cupredoxin domain
MTDSGLTRRDLLKVTAFGVTLIAIPVADSFGAARASELPPDRLPRPYTRQSRFVQPPVLQPGQALPSGRRLVTITQQESRFALLSGFSTRMWVYNGSFPGPTIRVQRGQQVTVRQINRLPAVHPLFGYPFATSTHLHGAPSLPQFDGYANDTTAPQQFKDYEYDNADGGQTRWYHDHAVHHTATNVYSGLAGQYQVIDPAEDRLGLPRGAFDVPLVIGDVAFRSDGQLLYDDRDTKGPMGDVILTNGVPWPAMPVEPRKYRFRILNASVARGYRLSLTQGAPMTVVATDGGLMPAPQTISQLKIGMAERYDVVVDFAPFRNSRVELLNLGVPNTVDFLDTNKVAAFDVADHTPAQVDQDHNGPIPATLDDAAQVMSLQPAQATRTRTMRFARDGGQWAVNGHTWQEVVDSGFQAVIADPAPDAIEIWELVNDSGGWFHPVHPHLVEFKVLDRNGLTPPPQERGPKDVVYLGEGERVRVIMKFETHTGRYMMHCHNTSHEDHDMMFQFRVGADSPANDPLGVPARPISQL